MRKKPSRLSKKLMIIGSSQCELYSSVQETTKQNKHINIQQHVCCMYNFLYKILFIGLLLQAWSFYDLKQQINIRPRTPRSSLSVINYQWSTSYLLVMSNWFWHWLYKERKQIKSYARTAFTSDRLIKQCRIHIFTLVKKAVGSFDILRNSRY